MKKLTLALFGLILLLLPLILATDINIHSRTGNEITINILNPETGDALAAPAVGTTDANGDVKLTFDVSRSIVNLYIIDRHEGMIVRKKSMTGISTSSGAIIVDMLATTPANTTTSTAPAVTNTTPVATNTTETITTTAENTTLTPTPTDTASSTIPAAEPSPQTTETTTNENSNSISGFSISSLVPSINKKVMGFTFLIIVVIALIVFVLIYVVKKRPLDIINLLIPKNSKQEKLVFHDRILRDAERRLRSAQEEISRIKMHNERLARIRVHHQKVKEAEERFLQAKEELNRIKNSKS